MQPFEYVILFFVICLIHGIYRAMQDVRQEAYNELNKHLRESLEESIVQIMGLSKAFMGVARSAESASESIRRLHSTLDCQGGMIRDEKELHGYLSKDCIS